MTKEVKPKKEKTKKESTSSLHTVAPKKKTTTTAKAKTKTKATAKTKASATKSKSKTTEKAKTSKAKEIVKTTKKTNSKKSTKTTSTKSSATKRKAKLDTKPIAPVSFLPEYYDLPYRYNQTIVRILAQTPTTLFVYWDISDADRNQYKEQFGDNFFEVTKPVLIIHNKTKNYYFEVEINDFANSWYLHVHDSDCVYEIEMGRRAKTQELSTIIPLTNNYLYIASSNDLETPNDHVLVDTIGRSIFFKDTKKQYVFEKDISSLHFMEHMGSVYPIYEMYHKIYKEELEDMKLRVSNPSSNPSSDSFLSRQ